MACACSLEFLPGGTCGCRNGYDGLVLPTRQVDFVARALDLLLPAHPLLDTRLGVPRRGLEQRLHAQRFQRAQDQLLDRLFDPQRPDVRAACRTALQLPAPTPAGVPHVPAATAIAHLHPPAATTAEQEPLQQRPAFARRAGSRSLAVGRDLALVALELLPREVALVMILDQHRPLLRGPAAQALDRSLRRIERFDDLAPAVDVGPGVERIPQQAIQVAFVRRLEARAVAGTAQDGHLDPVGEQRAVGGPHGTELLEAGEDPLDRRPHLRVRVLHQAAGVVPDVTRTRPEAERAPLRLAAHRFDQALLHHVQLGFTHRPFQAQQQPIVVGPRVVDPFGIADQRLTDRADVEQMVPIPVAPRNARDVEAENQADLSQRRLGDHLVEAGALAAAGRGLAQAWSKTVIRSGGQPSATARSTSSRWRRWLSGCWRTWWSDDCRT